MKIALTFPGCHRRGGVERVMVECANYLQHQGHETHIYASEWDVNALEHGIVRHVIKPGRRPWFLRPPGFYRQAERAIRQTAPPPDVIGGFGVVTPPGAVVWVTSVHGAWLEISRRQRDFKGRFRQRLNLAHPVILAMERSCFGGRRYRHLIALTEEVKADVMRLYAVPAGDISVLPNGFSPTEFNVTRTAAMRSTMRDKLGYRASDRVVLFAANELERKGFGPLLRAMAALNETEIRLLAVGRLDADRYQDEIRRLGMVHRVQFVGPTNDVASFYAAADVFALPTQYEAWGLVIVEALACGLPVLTSRLAGAAITVHEGTTGELLDDPHDVNEIGRKLSVLLHGVSASPEAISASVDDYRWPVILSRYEAILKEHAR